MFPYAIVPFASAGSADLEIWTAYCLRLTGICVKVVPNEGVLAIVAEKLGLNVRGGANRPKNVLQSNHLRIINSSMRMLQLRSTDLLIGKTFLAFFVSQQYKPWREKVHDIDLFVCMSVFESSHQVSPGPDSMSHAFLHCKHTPLKISTTGHPKIALNGLGL
jgi:hypothetical protein